MDALSHALIAIILFSHPALATLVPFAVFGAVILDIDIFFSPIADRNASLYLFAHGGIAHSIAGAFLLSLLAYGAAALVAAAGIVPESWLLSAGAYGFFAVLAGALLHLAIDTLACPGIPLLAPFLDRKYTLGILPGPSILLAFAALGAVAVTVAGLLPPATALALFGYTVIAYLAIRIAFFLVADAALPGRKIPTFNPLRWLVIREDEAAFRVGIYTMLRGYSGEAEFGKFRGTDTRGLEAVSRSAEVRRFLFHAYSVTAERIGDVLILADPVREKGYLYYPPKYKRVAVTSGNNP